MRSRPWSTALVLALLSVAGGACRSSGDDDGVNPIDASDGDGSTPDDTKIQDIQSEEMDIGTAVTVRRVVVVAKDTYGSRKGNFYVMEPEGGEYSGVLVFGAPLDQVDAISVGDLVDIENAEKDEFSLDTDTATITELVGAAGGQMSVTRVGTGTVPAPHVVDALANGRLPEAMRKVEQEKWEHVLIKIENVTVTREVRNINGNPPDPTFKDFLVTGYYNVDSSLAEIPDMHVARGDCLASVTGMGDYFFNYKVLIRSTADIVTGGTGCPAPEADATACGDMIDNDANGFADCNDNSCRAAVPACITSTTVTMVQNGTVPTNSSVTLSNVVVTAIGSVRAGETATRNIWVADALQAAPHNGVQVFRGTNPAALPAGVVVGATISVTGRVQEFMSGAGLTLTEISPVTGSPGTPTITFVAAPAGAPIPLAGVSIADLTTDPLVNMPYGNAEQYEGVFVDIANVKVTTATDGFGQRNFTGPGGTSFVSISDIASLMEPNDTCYAHIRGLWTYQVNLDKWAIAPLGGAANTMTGGTCN